MKLCCLRQCFECLSGSRVSVGVASALVSCALFVFVACPSVQACGKGGSDQDAVTPHTTGYYGVVAVHVDDADKAAEYQKGADRGDPEAQYQLGLCYFLGKGVNPDIQRAIELFREAAHGENAGAYFMLGECYKAGKGVEKNQTESMKCYEQGAARGHSDALFAIVEAADDGDAEANRWMKEQSSISPEEARRIKEAVKSQKKAKFKRYESSARSGNADAQCIVGVAYLVGRGVDKDPKQAVKWFRMASQQGSPDAIYWLGTCYHDGQGVSRNPSESTKCFIRAASLGHAKALQALRQAAQNGDKAAITWLRGLSR